MSTIVWIRLEIDGDPECAAATVDGVMDVGDLQDAIEGSAIADGADLSVVSALTFSAASVLGEVLHDALQARINRNYPTEPAPPPQGVEP